MVVFLERERERKAAGGGGGEECGGITPVRVVEEREEITIFKKK
jgi:hypothetical protein